MNFLNVNRPDRLGRRSEVESIPWPSRCFGVYRETQGSELQEKCDSDEHPGNFADSLDTNCLLSVPLQPFMRMAEVSKEFDVGSPG